MFVFPLTLKYQTLFLLHTQVKYVHLTLLFKINILEKHFRMDKDIKINDAKNHSAYPTRNLTKNCPLNSYNTYSLHPYALISCNNPL